MANLDGEKCEQLEELTNYIRMSVLEFTEILIEKTKKKSDKTVLSLEDMSSFLKLTARYY